MLQLASHDYMSWCPLNVQFDNLSTINVGAFTLLGRIQRRVHAIMWSRVFLLRKPNGPEDLFILVVQEGTQVRQSVAYDCPPES
jgi:hypothetical protein